MHSYLVVPNLKTLCACMQTTIGRIYSCGVTDWYDQDSDYIIINSELSSHSSGDMCPSVHVIHSQPSPLLSADYNSYTPVASHPHPYKWWGCTELLQVQACTSSFVCKAWAIGLGS